jgi:hypothetical protein
MFAGESISKRVHAKRLTGEDERLFANAEALDV